MQNLNDDLSNDMSMTMYMVGASQAFVPGERRRSLERAAEAAARSLEATRRTLAAEVGRDAVAAWLTVAGIDERRQVVQTVLVVTDAIIASSRARYESGSAIQADILRAQLVRSDLQHTVLSLDGDRRIAEAALRSLLGLDSAAEIPRLHLEHASPPAPPGAPIADDHPAIASLEADVERRLAEIDFAKSATRPEWSVEASYGYRPEDNGMISVLGRVELPVRRKQVIEPRIREAIARRDAALQKIEELRRSLTSRPRSRRRFTSRPSRSSSSTTRSSCLRRSSRSTRRSRLPGGEERFRSASRKRERLRPPGNRLLRLSRALARGARRPDRARAGRAHDPRRRGGRPFERKRAGPRRVQQPFDELDVRSRS